MSGTAHSTFLARPDGRYFSLVREAVDVSGVALPEPPDGYLRLANPLLVEANGIRIFNPAPPLGPAADVEVVIDTPRGTFKHEILGLAAGGVAASFPLPTMRGETVRIVLLSTSGAGAKIDVSVNYSDLDVITKKVVPLEADYTTILEGGPGEALSVIAMAAEANPGPALDLDARVEAGSTLVSIGFATGLVAGFISNFNKVPPILRDGFKLQARRTAGTGNFVVFNVVGGVEFFGSPR